MTSKMRESLLTIQHSPKPAIIWHFSHALQTGNLLMTFILQKEVVTIGIISDGVSPACTIFTFSCASFFYLWVTKARCGLISVHMSYTHRLLETHQATLQH